MCGFLASREVREGIWGGIASNLHPTQTVVKVQQFATKLGLVLTEANDEVNSNADSAGTTEFLVTLLYSLYVDRVTLLIFSC